MEDTGYRCQSWPNRNNTPFFPPSCSGVVEILHLLHSDMCKTCLMKKIKDSKELQELSYVISDPDVTPEKVGEAGITLFIYNHA